MRWNEPDRRRRRQATPRLPDERFARRSRRVAVDLPEPVHVLHGVLR